MSRLTFNCLSNTVAVPSESHSAKMAQDRGDTVNDEARLAQGTLDKECGFALQGPASRKIV